MSDRLLRLPASDTDLPNSARSWVRIFRADESPFSTAPLLVVVLYEVRLLIVLAILLYASTKPCTFFLIVSLSLSTVTVTGAPTLVLARFRVTPLMASVTVLDDLVTSVPSTVNLASTACCCTVIV